MNLLFDTNIILTLVRVEDFTSMLDFFNPDGNTIYISVATEAEVKSIVLQNKWGINKRSRLDYLFGLIIIVEIYQANVSSYIEIDVYSQRKNPAFVNYPFETPRNMGKNDLWIASLAALLGLQLVTTDADFDHLNGVFFDVRRIPVSEFQRFF